MPTNEEIENEPQHITYIDELLWLLEDARRVAYGEANVSVLKEVIDEMSDGIPEWLESLKDKLRTRMTFRGSKTGMSFVYHAGSGTYFGAEDDAFIIDLEGLRQSDYYVDDDLDWYRWEQLEPHARPVIDYLKEG